MVVIDPSITTVTYGRDCGQTINATTTVAYFKITWCVNDIDDIHTYMHTYSLSSSSSSSSSRLFIDILQPVILRGISYRINNRYPGHKSHLLLLYKKEKEKHNMYCGVKICFTSANIIKIVHCPHR